MHERYDQELATPDDGMRVLGKSAEKMSRMLLKALLERWG
jgi:hypothetical protein